MLRRMLLAASDSDRLHKLIVSAPYTRDVVARYVAGDDAAAAVEATRRLQADGLAVSLDYLGEDTTSQDQAGAVAAEYIALLGLLAAGGLTRGGRAEVSVKPTAVGLHLPEQGEKTAAANMARICAAARAAGTTVTVDMEDHTHVDATLRIVRELRGDFPDLGCVIQSQLRRSAADCAALAYPGSRVRLCKGAYDAPEPVAFAGRAEVDRSYARCLRVLMAGGGYPMLATHDLRLIEIGAAQAVLTGRGTTGFEYQMLYGVRPAEQRRLAGTGATMRVYLPYGQDWYRYLVRRLAERPANLAFFLRSLASRT
ncbi:MAG TPA: proline dehydrogenase family protein [Streptosporangiaceae bacterium]|nr:proline dehydrogenase family protein [Streptosporangiaceae bacterium]